MPPPNPGSAASAGSSSHAASSGFQQTTREATYPFLKTDLQFAETCSIHRLLGVLLGRCRSDPPHRSAPLVSNPSTPTIPQANENSSLDDSPHGSDKTEKAATKPSAATLQDSDPKGREPGDNDLLEVCLQRVLPLCNEDCFRQLIREYCMAPQPEGNRYPPFASACNHALKWLRALDVPHLRPASSCEILFHVNDPGSIAGYDHSHRSPDINIVSIKAAQRVHGRNDNWDSFAGDPCREAPLHLNFEWSDVLGFAEFKRFAGMAPQFPDKFDCTLHEPVPPHVLSDDLATSGSTTNISNSESDHSQMVAAGGGGPSSDISFPTATGDLPGDVSGASRGTKRSLETNSSVQSQDRSKKQKGDAKQKIQDGIMQCGLYAMEMFANSAARQHVLSLFIVDDVVWVWWYDRQGSIQSSGINIPRDLPLFVVLLFILQRLSRTDWGYNLELEAAAPQDTPAGSEPPAVQASPSIRFDEREVSIHLHDVLHRPFHLVGRGTWVFGASSLSVDTVELVAKLSWPNKKRVSERRIIEQAVMGAPNAKDHLPKVFASCDSYDTEEIRRQLGIDSRGPSRVFRIIVFERLHSITSVSGLDRITAIVQCVKCHYLVWQAGVQHRDLSQGNLMVRKQKDTYLGVLNDWDLSHAVGLSEDTEERMATLPFLAIDLLAGYWEGNSPVEYRHDLESFMWIIYWISRCSLSSHGKLVAPTDMLQWTTSASACRQAKAVLVIFFQEPHLPTTIDSRVAVSLLCDFAISYLSRKSKVLNGTWSKDDEPSDRSRLENFLQLVSRALSPENFQLPHSPVID
ncbi:hypothetical protein FRC06_006050 [Ceratobasidium sp. 370]|nr:hypothetical protein FRC06_006050 [Ceratobasidium sp. 370]